tara:strand:+ start:81 stop:269 length:189 start_codon:yes stop_codon:yes gene_type:complete
MLLRKEDQKKVSLFKKKVEISNEPFFLLFHTKENNNSKGKNSSKKFFYLINTLQMIKISNAN